MKKILTSAQIKLVDSHTIEHEPISSLDLMERASRSVADRLASLFPTPQHFIVFAGPGNNGGDALAVARMMAGRGHKVDAYLFNVNGHMSRDCEANRNRLRGCQNLTFHEIVSDFIPPVISSDDVVVDGLFGTGLSRPLSGGFAAVVKYINAAHATVVAIDVPSGLMTEDNASNVAQHIVQATHTFTFHSPKLAFLLPENEQFVGRLEVLDIGLIDPDTAPTATPFHLFTQADAEAMLHVRPRFAHKGTFGHACLIAGRQGMAGAAILASRACMRSGAGKLTVRTPEANLLPLQVAIPEAVLDIEQQSPRISKPIDTAPYSALAIGPGLGTDEQTAKFLAQQLHYHQGPLVLDADALNLLASHPDLLQLIPAETILTPHKKELRGLIGQTANSFEELQQTRLFAEQCHAYVIIKGANSAIVCPDGTAIYNTTGNPGMATAGSGDVLTGVILSFLAQGYSPLQASLLGTYLHGLAGDLAAQHLCQESLIASDIIEHLHLAFRQIG